MSHSSISTANLMLPSSLTQINQNPLQMLKSLWEANNGIFVLEVLEDGLEFRYLAFNPTSSQFSPISVEKLIGKTLQETSQDCIYRRYYDTYCQCAQSNQPLTLEDCFYKGEQEFWLQLTIHPLSNHGDRVDQLLVTTVDITERVRSELTCKQKAVELQQSYQILQEILDTLPISIVWKDFNSVFQGANRLGLSACGLSSVSDIVGRTDYDMPWTKEESDWYRLCDRRVMESGQAELNILETQQRADGQQVTLSTSKVPLRDADGKVTGIVVAIQEISDRISLEAKEQRMKVVLAESEAKFRGLVEDANDVIATWNLDTTLTYISPSFQTLFGYAPSDWIGQSFIPLVHPDDLSTYAIANQEVAETGEKLAGIEFRHRRQQGDWVWVSVSIVPIKDTSGAVIAFQGILRDIHQSKQQATAMRFIVEETASKTGVEFFRSCVRSLSDIFQTQYAFIAHRVDATYRQSEMLVLWTGEEFAESYTFDLAGTPCSMVFQHQWGIFPEQLQAKFPAAPSLATLGAESYVGVAIIDSYANRIGNLGIIDTKPLLDNLDTAKSILQLFASRVGAEMERSAAETVLKEYAERQALLNRLTNQIRNSLNVDTVLKTTIEELYTLLQVDWCAFSWYDPTVQPAQWHVVVDYCFDNSSWVGSYSAELVGAIDQIVLQLETMRIDRAEEYAEQSHRAFLISGGTRSRLCVPIQTQREQLGIIICDHKQRHHCWEDGEVELVQAVAGQLAIAIDQAELYAQSQAKSQKLQVALETLQRTQTQMVQSEKMSSLGQLVAGIAHEINNPINFIHGNVSHVEQYAKDLLELVTLYQQHYPNPVCAIADKIENVDLEFLSQDLPKLLTSMQLGTERIREIVKSLRLFSRLDEAEVKPVDIHDGIESALMILQNRINSKSDAGEIQIIKNYGELPLVECFAGQLNQVFMSILINAIDAVEQNRKQGVKCRIQISTALVRDGWVAISIADNGTGIDESVRSQIFDPFFTTKPVGQGTGLGLSISYQIVTEQHSGRLQCNSVPDKGTTFVIEIPVHQVIRQK